MSFLLSPNKSCVALLLVGLGADGRQLYIAEQFRGPGVDGKEGWEGWEERGKKNRARQARLIRNDDSSQTLNRTPSNHPFFYPHLCLSVCLSACLSVSLCDLYTRIVVFKGRSFLLHSSMKRMIHSTTLAYCGLLHFVLAGNSTFI